MLFSEGAIKGIKISGFDGRKINNDTYYDNLGKVQRASLPYFIDEQSYFATYNNDPAKWHLGRLTKATVTHKAPNTPNITRTRYNQSYPYIAQVVATKEYIETNGSPNSLYKNEPQNSLYQVTTTTNPRSNTLALMDAKSITTPTMIT